MLCWVGARIIFIGLTSLNDAGFYRSDILWHNDLLIEASRGATLPTYTLYYPLLTLASGGHLSPERLKAVAIVVLSTFMTLKVVAAFCALRYFTGRVWASALAAAVAALLVPLKLDGSAEFYLGRFSGAIWHNSTTVMLMPLAVVVWALTFYYLTEKRVPRWLPWAVALSAAVCAAAKPNYVLVLVPAAFLFCMALLFSNPRVERGAAFRRLARRWAVVAVGAIAVVAPVYLGLLSTGGAEGTTFAIRPLATWFTMDEHPWLRALESFLAPAVATALLWKTTSRRLLTYSWLGVLVGVTQFALLAEVRADGTTLHHGNWSWGGHTATFLLNVAVLASLLRSWRDLTWWSRALILILIGAQLVLGMVYLTRLYAGAIGYR